jgi:SAM-dependent methyltransferase
MRQIILMYRHFRLFSIRNSAKGWHAKIKAWLRFWKSFKMYTQLAKPGELPKVEHLYPCLWDNTPETAIEPTYFYQDAWAFEKIVLRRPSRHYDVGSHHKFVALLSKVVPVTMVDIRPLSLPLDTLDFKQGTILDLPFDDSSIDSLSSLCVVEHIGLGRYGDPLDPNGTEKAIEQLKRVMKPEGDLYLSIPLDDENRTYFNAHRAYKESYVFSMFSGFHLLEARYIYGCEFGAELKTGFGTACYHFRRMK